MGETRKGEGDRDCEGTTLAGMSRVPAGTDLDVAALADEMRRTHGAHTVVLFGSRARGDAAPTSDVDVLAVRADGGPDRDVRRWRGFDLDVHVLDEQGLAAKLIEHAPGLAHARVLAQDAGSGDRLIARARYLLSQPPPAQDLGYVESLWAWGAKMRERIRSADPTLAAVQRAIVLVQSLPAWAEVRRRWFFGTKDAIATLGRDDPDVHRALLAAAAPGAEVEAFDRLLDAVFDPALRPPPRS